MYALACGQRYGIVQNADGAENEEEKQKLALDEYQDKAYQITTTPKFQLVNYPSSEETHIAQPRAAQKVYLKIEMNAPKNQIEAQVNFSVEGATVLQRPARKITISDGNKIFLGVILTGEHSPALRCQIFYQRKLIYTHRWQQAPEQEIRSRQTTVEDRLVEELRKPTPDI